MHLNDREDPGSVTNIWKYEWRVRSRWIKFEQTVNKMTDKWGEPYVGPLLYQELVYLKNNLQTGTIILSCQKTDFSSVIDEVLDDFTNRGQVCLFNQWFKGFILVALTHSILLLYHFKDVGGSQRNTEAYHSDSV